MIEIEQFQVRGLTGAVHKVRFGTRTVDYWAPANPGHHVLVAHDGQNIFDKRNIGINPHQRATWELAKSAARIAELNDLTPPTVIGIYHTPYVEDNLGRVKEYTPAQFMSKREDLAPVSYGLYPENVDAFLSGLNADEHIENIVNLIVPTITQKIGQTYSPETTALLGASMGGLAAIYGVIRKPDFFHTALSFSPHWIIGGNKLAENLMNAFPEPGTHKLWMSRGTKGLDAKYEEPQDLATKLIKERGYREGTDLKYRTLNHGAHSNATWARYVADALNFWLQQS
jgi:predicted alpha/beta superfamily hydrolase